MANVRPRLSVTLDFEDYENLKELSKYTGESASQMIGEMVAYARPTTTAFLSLFKKLEQVKAESPEQVTAYFEGKSAVIQALSALPQEQIRQMEAYLNQVKKA